MVKKRTFMSDKKSPKGISHLDYKKLFDVNNPDSNKKEALQYALEIRKFEIELYWRRSAYFWTLIAGALTGYFLTFNDDKSLASIIVGCLGFVFSLAWFLLIKVVNIGRKTGKTM